MHMLGRLIYYSRKASQEVHERGLLPVSRDALKFLVRRRFFLQFASEAIEYHLFARCRSVPSTLRAAPHRCETQITDRCLIYASFDRDSRIQPHVLQQLKCFNDLGYLKSGFRQVFLLPAEGGTPRQLSSGSYNYAQQSFGPEDAVWFDDAGLYRIE